MFKDERKWINYQLREDYKYKLKFVLIYEKVSKKVNLLTEWVMISGNTFTWYVETISGNHKRNVETIMLDNNCEVSQIRRKSTGNKGNTLQASSKDLNIEVTNENKNLDKQGTSISAKSTKVTGASQLITREPSIKQQLKPKPKSTKGNKCTRDKDNPSSQKSPPKKRMNSDMPIGGVNPTGIKSRPWRIKKANLCRNKTDVGCY